MVHNKNNVIPNETYAPVFLTFSTQSPPYNIKYMILLFKVERFKFFLSILKSIYKQYRFGTF